MNPHEPYCTWEEYLWPVFDRLKSAMDKQEAARTQGTLGEFVKTASELFWYFEGMVQAVWQFDPDAMKYTYLGWKRSRKIESWFPDVDLPLKWVLALNMPVPEPDEVVLERMKEKHRRWAEHNKDAAKQMKAYARTMEREKKKLAKAKTKTKKETV